MAAIIKVMVSAASIASLAVSLIEDSLVWAGVGALFLVIGVILWSMRD